MKPSPIFLYCLLFLLACKSILGQEIRTYMDLQIHPTMHMAHPIIGKGLLYFKEGEEPDLTHLHQLTNVNYANYLEDNPGLRIIAHGAIVPEVFSNRADARKLLLAELQYVNDFAAANPDKFVVAKSPDEVRHQVLNTNKTVIIHCVEGAEFLIHSQEDAHFWADQGIAFMTLIHLVDNRLGGAATLPMAATKLINFRGTVKSWFQPPGKTKGLTKKGKQVILWMANAGIMIDLTHCSPQTRTDALAFMEEHGIAPISTHDGFKPIQNFERGITEEEVVQLYKNGGLMSLGVALSAYQPYPAYQAKLDSMADTYCDGSIDSYQFTYTELNHFIERHLAEIFEDENLNSFSDLSEEQKVQVAIGFQTDFNGWINHERPRVGPDGCFEQEPGKTYHPIETEGMRHPGMMADHWDYLRQKGVDLQPIERASERFLQVWQSFLDQKGRFDGTIH